jgi:hypothetical protein
LDSLGFKAGENVYVVNLDNGMIAVLKKSSFKQHLRDKVKVALETGDPETKELKDLTDFEMDLLRKIAGIRFEERSHSNIKRLLSDKEMAQLQELINKGVINLYKGGKYSAEGVYTVPKKYFSSLRISGENSQSKTFTSPVDSKKVDDLIKTLDKNGFLVVEDDETAKSVSYKLQDKVKAGLIKGIKGFDSKYYIFTSKKYGEFQRVIEDYLKENKRSTLSEISKSTSLDEAVCKGVLTFMLEESDIIEKSRGKYELVV